MAKFPHEGDTIVKASWPEVRESLIFEESKQTMQQLVEIIKICKTITCRSKYAIV